MTLKEFCQFLTRLKERDCKPTTVSSFMHISSIICNYFQNVDIADISIFMIDNFLLDLNERINAQGKHYSNATKKDIYNCLKHIFTVAYNKKVIKENVFLGVTKPKFYKHKVSVLSQKDIQKLFRKLNNNENLKWAVYIYLLFTTGKRRGEVLALEWKDIDLNNRAIRFNKSYVYTREHGTYISTTKSNKNSLVVVPQFMINKLCELKRQYTNSFKQKVPAHIFINENTGEILHPCVPTKKLNCIKKELKIKRLTPHLIRHTVATLLFEQGATAKEVSHLLDHSNPAFTLTTYVHPNEHKISEKNCSLIEKALNI